MTEHKGDAMEHEPMTYWGWISPRPGLLAGYLADPQGAMHLYAVLQYPPITSASMRAISLRSLDDPRAFEGPSWRGPVAPPTPQQLDAAWGEQGQDPRWQEWMRTLQLDDAEQGALLGRMSGEVATRLHLLQQHAAEATLSREALTRQPDEPADNFYMRVGDAYLLLAAQTSKPTKRLAEIAGVSQAAATSWVHRARARNHIPPIEVLRSMTEAGE
jgi:hypothetical protein